MHKIAGLFRRRQIASDLQEEMQFHRALRVKQLRRETGLNEAEAAASAQRSFGNATLWQEDSLSMWRWNAIEDLGTDVRYALRWMKREPLFVAVVILTLTLGIGANTAMFSLTNGLLLRLLPVRDAQQLHYLHVLPQQPEGANNTGIYESSFSYAVYQSLREQKHTFANVVGYVPLSFDKNLIRTDLIPEEAAVDMVSGDFFSALGVPLRCGTGFHSSDEQLGSSIAVISYGLWSRKFSRDCSTTVGYKILIKGFPFTVVGVTSESFRGVEGSSATDVWIPFQRRPEFNAWSSTNANYRTDSKWWCLRLLARLSASSKVSEATLQIQPAFRQAAYAPFGGKPRRGERPRELRLIPIRGLGQPELKQPLTVLMTTVSLILLIACTNVATMLLARNSARQREFGIRQALGGGRWRFFRQLLAESLLLVSAGTLIGYVLAWNATGLLAKWAAIDASLAPDRTVLLFTLVVSITISLGLALIPLFTQASAVSAEDLSRHSQSTGFSDRVGLRSRQLALVTQIALGFVLLASAGLFTRSLRNLQLRNLGFAADQLLVFGIDSPPDAVAGEKNSLLFGNLMERLRHLPGVESATSAENRPGSNGSNNTNIAIDGRNDRMGRNTGSNMARWNGVGPNYFRTIGVPLREGREFNQADSATSTKVGIINETLAREFFGKEPALGHTISMGSLPRMTIVGIVADHIYTSLHEEDLMPMAFYPDTQSSFGASQILLRTSIADPLTLLNEVRHQIAAYNPDLAPLQPRTERAEFAATADTERLIARLALFFGGMAAVLVATGLYGTISYRVNRRTAELGIRMAIGAQRPQIAWLILRESLTILLFGLCLGLPISLITGRWLASLLYELTPYDGLSLAIAGLGIIVVTLLASLIPAQRAAAIDPIRALRYE